jgi:hypothetical protein
MPARPHDISDLYLAPMALEVDARLEELGRLDKERLAYEVALEADSPDFTREMREEGLIRTITHMIETHKWELSWDPRRVPPGQPDPVTGSRPGGACCAGPRP